MILDNIKKLNIILPKAPEPVGAYVAYKIIGKILYISGQLPIDKDGKIIKGKIGKDLTLEDGQNASKLCIANILAQTQKALNGDLNKLKNCIKITGYVNSTNDFIDQPKVLNPASEALVAIFGDAGKHTRVAVSANSLPLGIAVEIDAIFEIK
jgi:enamine deaminase RidA (YjgF/YER057c/UK114 family)